MIIVHTSKRLAASAGGTGQILSDAASELRLIVEFLPAEFDFGNYAEVGARLLVGGQNIPIVSYEETADERNAGKTFSVELLRPQDKSLLTWGAEFLIETFVLNGAGAKIWEPVHAGTINSKSVSIQNASGAPADTVSFTTVSTDRLAKAPTRNLVVYDPARARVDPSEFETVYDNFGKSYTLETLTVASLSLHKLFDLIFKERCGFDQVKTNLPDYPIQRADFSIFGTFYDGIKPFIGAFRAIDFQTPDNVLWITDKTATLPAGFPAPRALPAAKIQSISQDAQLEKISGFELQFSQAETGDFYTTKTSARTQETKTLFGTLIAKTVVTTKIRQYRSNNARHIVLREAVESEKIETYGSETLFPVGVTEENFEFDYLGRFKSSTKTVQKRLPDMAADGAVSLREVSNEELEHEYAVNPFSPRLQFLKRTKLIVEGRIAVDAENKYLDEDFVQELTVAHRSGNLKQGMTEEFGTVKSVTEEFTPQRDGMVKVFRTEIDHTPEFIGRDAIVTTSMGEPRAGEVSVSSASRPGKIYVFLDGDGFTDAARPAAFPVGELPLYLAIPLAKRLLEQQDPERFQVALVSWHKTIEQGTILTATGRDNETFNVIVTGYRKFVSVRGGALDAGMTLTAEKLGSGGSERDK